MPKLEPTPGMVTRQTAVQALMREKVINSPSMLAKLKGIRHEVLPNRTHGFYSEEDLIRTINEYRARRNQPPTNSLFSRNLKFRQATVEDMTGVYQVAHKLFGNTTSASTRISLLEKCPEGNVIVTDSDIVVSFAHLYPLRNETLQQFLAGKIRGPQINVDDLDCFETGKVVDILVKSMGSYHEHKGTAKLYSKALFLGLRHELIQWGHKGYIINRVYATSETQSGIEAAADFKMQSLGKIPGSKGKKRYAYELNPFTSDLSLAQYYREAIEDWSKQHPQEYEKAWQIWREQHHQKL